jgi:hypothetical protein
LSSQSSHKRDKIANYRNDSRDDCHLSGAKFIVAFKHAIQLPLLCFLLSKDLNGTECGYDIYFYYLIGVIIVL